jgi:hypothetical protein
MVGQRSWGGIRRIGCQLEVRIIVGGDYMDEELQGWLFHACVAILEVITLFNIMFSSWFYACLC